MSDQVVYEILLINLSIFYLDNKNVPEAEGATKSFEINMRSPLILRNGFQWIICLEKEYAKVFFA